MAALVSNISGGDDISSMMLGRGGGISFDISMIRSYLASLLSPVMAATRTDLESSLFGDVTFEDKAERFATDGSHMVAYITKERNLRPEEDDGEDQGQDGDHVSYTYTLHLPPVPSHTPSLISTLSLIKKKPILDPSTPLAHQLHFVMLSTTNNQSLVTSGDKAGDEAAGDDAGNENTTIGTPYEGLHSLVHFGVTPWFDAYISSKKVGVSLDSAGGKKAGEAQMGIPVAKRKFAELELSLLHLQQNVEIPETHLIIHPAVQRAVEQAHASGNRLTIDSIQPASLLTDDAFLNRLQSDVNLWIKEIQAVTKLNRDVASGTASQEVNFWLSMERALEGIEAQLAGEEVQLTLSVLKSAKRFHATTSFVSDTGLKEATDTVVKYNALMRDFPLNELLSATELEKIRESLYLVFGHLNKKLKVSPYPLRRTLPLVEAISSDFNEQCVKVLTAQRLMYMDYASFESTMTAAMEVFATWDENIKEFTNVAREVMRKRNEKFIPVKINSAHVKTQERVAYLRDFRRTHEQLRVMTGTQGGLKGLGSENMLDVNMEEEVRSAYEGLKPVPVLDTSLEGTEIWITAESTYNERVARVENQIISRLRDRLATARNAHEMFRIFSKFNSLFVRPKIRGAIQEYQTRLIDSVKEDIKKLHLKFTSNYRNSEAFHMSQLRDLPPVASAIIWAKQIEKQLSADMKRVEDVLGKGWEMYAEGERLKAESDFFRKKLNTTPIFDAWVQDVTRREQRVGGRLLEIIRQRNAPIQANGQPALELAVNFDPQTITLFKEVRNLLWLNFPVPHTIINYAKEAKRIYPHAVNLMESVRIYNQLVEVIDENESVGMLVADYRTRAQELIVRGLGIRWETVAYSYGTPRTPAPGNRGMEEDGSITFFREFASVIAILQEKTTVVIEVDEQISGLLEELASCPYENDVLTRIMSTLQQIADRLNLEGYTNLEEWVNELDEKVMNILRTRLTNKIDEWCKDIEALSKDPSSVAQLQAIAGTTHELHIKNQVIYLNPPLEMAQAAWLKQLQRLMGVVCGQARIKSARYEMSLQNGETTFERRDCSVLLPSLPDTVLERPFRLIQEKLNFVRGYVDRWLQMQALWDLEQEIVYGHLGDSLPKWSKILTEIKQSRATFDTTETQRDFGLCVIAYANVQGKVAAKYDSWQRDILNRYGSKLGERMRDINTSLSKARQELERQTITGSSTAQAVTFITFVQDLKRKVGQWSPDVTALEEGQRTLEKQRYAFPDDWLHADRIAGEWGAFHEILKRKDATIQEQLAGLRLKVAAEHKVILEKISASQADWDAHKPIQGGIKPEAAINSIQTFETRVSKLNDDHEMLRKAQDALNIAVSEDKRLQPILDEIKDLRAVWLALSGVATQVNEVRDTLWNLVQPRKVRQTLDSIIANMRELPTRMRQYAAYEHVHEAIKTLLKFNTIVTELKGDAMRERHWRHLFQSLRVSYPYRESTLTLGNVYDLDLKINEKPIKAICEQARGERNLEEYLRTVRDFWTDFNLSLVQYQSKCRLIKGWDDLFSACSEHLNGLTAMKSSPYYRVFDEEAASWDNKLTAIQTLFDVWIDVQRQWVYLEGIFTNNADIKQLLPVESARFGNIDSEFLAAMRKVYKSPLVLDVLVIPGIQKTFERLAEALGKIQKALGEYLERERSTFPRFYFLGDEDLLEIIGNSSDALRVTKHLKKMFAGLASLETSADDTTVVAMTSRDGETVTLSRPIILAEYRKVNDWLARLEKEMKTTLADTLYPVMTGLEALYSTSNTIEGHAIRSWIEAHPAQLVILAIQAAWTQLVQDRLSRGHTLQAVLDLVQTVLEALADAVVGDLNSITRRKCEHLITELVHQRDVTRSLIQSGVTSANDFEWLRHMRFYFDADVEDRLKCLRVEMADAVFDYGFEYLGIPDRLVQTPLTDKCFLTLTQALHTQLGGSPFGPAGTGKTESVKALGVSLGRFVLVFCCDEAFDFQAMGRIFSGVCQVGAWGCFDEFNRLDERMLSAVSSQIQVIQQGLASTNGKSVTEISLIDKKVQLDPQTGIFVTMNPGYAGRSNLPDNLKKLFRSVAMSQPDRELIAQVMLFSQGFRHAEGLASKIVPFFEMCREQLSAQSHYDFGLRALKSVLLRAGILIREHLGSISTPASSETSEQREVTELELMVRSLQETLVPKLLGSDVSLIRSIVTDVFPNVSGRQSPLDELRKAIGIACDKRHLQQDDSWIEKVIQLCQVQQISHGVMLVGPSASGKSESWRVLLDALGQMDGIEGVSYVVDPKAIQKDDLYGVLDNTTREWTDGLFTSILRRITDDARGESGKRHWIVFDGDVDPEWVENLNSVLDDNRLLTLPNGERLYLPGNVRVMFEVDSLRYATPATVSRCGMIWFSQGLVTAQMLCAKAMETLQTTVLPTDEQSQSLDSASSAMRLRTQQIVAQALAPSFLVNGLVFKALSFAETLPHIMEFSPSRALSTLFYAINKAIRTIQDYNDNHADFPLANDRIELYMRNRLLLDLVWAFVGDASGKDRAIFARFLQEETGIQLPVDANDHNTSVIDFDVDLKTGNWINWQERVPTIEIETHAVTAADVVIPTIDTVRHEEVLYSWVIERKPLVLCGPPGSGKTMTLMNALRKLPEVEMAGLNFSSATSPELILKTFEQYCEYKKNNNGIVLAPTSTTKWLVVFCDEINLPAEDTYGTQRVISFMRQMIEHGGFWRTSDLSWVKLERIQFVGACNPPTDPGRVPLSTRFLRHAPVLMVDYPGSIALKQIYGTFARALLKVVPTLRRFAEALTEAMVEVYQLSQSHFTADQQAHYVYSPRELSRWVRGIYEALRPLESLDLDGLVRLWAHEGLRLFQDRLVHEYEKVWTDQLIDDVALRHFPTVDRGLALQRPILYSNWTTKDYLPIGREALRDFVKARLRVFYEEELDVPLVLYDDILDHVLRIDRVFRQPQGHVLLIGVSGSGKTTLSRFVAWMNGLSIFQIQVSNRYTAADFDEDLRTVLRRAGCKGEKMCFIMDESNALDSAFLERMNTLLANAEIPGLFEGDEFQALMNSCKEGSQRDGLMLDSTDELYRWFTSQISKNLHVVFTMNPPSDGVAGRAATSPALFNRCVLNWFGNWSNRTLFQVGTEMTAELDLDNPEYDVPATLVPSNPDMPKLPSHREAVANAMVTVHLQAEKAMRNLQDQGRSVPRITPRHFLDFITQYVKIVGEKQDDLQDQQRHINTGIDKLRETVTQVSELKKELSIKEKELHEKNAEANAKLKQMIADQQEAEAKKLASLSIQEQLSSQEEITKQRQATVNAELADVEPAVAEASNAVGSIKKQQLAELQKLRVPPAAIVMAAEATCALLGHQNLKDWTAIAAIVRRDDFVYSIQHFDTSKVDAALCRRLQRDYLSREDFTFEVVNRANKAMGPLALWVMAQVKYATILDRIEPLRQEVDELEHKAYTFREQAKAVQEILEKLEGSIATYKDEYAALVSETQAIRTEMKKVQEKVDRSSTLLASLSQEETRWSRDSAEFAQEMTTLIGDALLSAGFLTYLGYFDQRHRRSLWNEMLDHLVASNIAAKPDLALPEYLATADDRAKWTAAGLPVDDLATENAMMIQRFNRFPLLIDPTGQASAFLTDLYREKKVMSTSFIDASFVKNLESALRFGSPLLVHDVENLDPVLNSVLNREVRRSGGRNLIRIGNQDIDLSPAFTLFLATRDPLIAIPPDLSSRVTVVNFTMTRGSLESQSLDKILKAERPDTENRRTNLIKAQGEFRLRLRHLEKMLLNALNESSGSILENDKLIATLEGLKREAADISQKMLETESIASEIEQVTKDYKPIARSASAIYFLLERLGDLNHFYRFSLDFFLELFDDVLLRNPRLQGVKDLAQRQEIITQDLFSLSYERVARTLLQDDHVLLSLALAQMLPLQQDQQQAKSLLQSMTRTTGPSDVPMPSLLETVEQQQVLSLVSEPKQLSELMSSDPGAWQKALADTQPEVTVPTLISGICAEPVASAALVATIMSCLRPDRFIASSAALTKVAFAAPLQTVDSGRALEDYVDAVNASSTPIVLCSVPGYDASFRVDALAASRKHDCASIAMGSSEGTRLADQAISHAARTGSWVLLKNVHLAPEWLSSLEKRLRTIHADKRFRLFLTMETSPKIPVSILLQSRIIMNEPAPGVRASVLESLQGFEALDNDAGPAEATRLYFLLAWFHAVVQERSRYNPLGWSSAYDFNDADLYAAAGTMKRWLSGVARGRSNIDPAQIPWIALRSLLNVSIYGGRVDSTFDQQILNSFSLSLFHAGAFESDFKLVDDENPDLALKMPDALTLASFKKWAHDLPEENPHSWLGLPAESERVLLEAKGRRIMTRLRALREPEEVDVAVSSSSSQDAGGRPEWMQQLGASCTQQLGALPKSLPATQDNKSSDPIVVAFAREAEQGRKLLGTIREDLQNTASYLAGDIKPTNHITRLVQAMRRGEIPSNWKRYTVRRDLSLVQWLSDFAKRLAQLQAFLEGSLESVDIGLLFHPSAYITATRQSTAQKNGWSLETLSMEIDLGSTDSTRGYVVTGLQIEGGQVENGGLSLNEGGTSLVGASTIRWQQKPPDTRSGRADNSTVDLPMYVNGERQALLATIKVGLNDDLTRVKVVQRGCCLKTSM